MFEALALIHCWYFKVGRFTPFCSPILFSHIYCFEVYINILGYTRTCDPFGDKSKQILFAYIPKLYT